MTSGEVSQRHPGRRAHQDHRECEKGPFGRGQVGQGSQENRQEEVLYKTTQEITTSVQLNDHGEGRQRLEWKVERAIWRDALRQGSFYSPLPAQLGLRME